MALEKQNKVLNKITYDSGQTTPLGTVPNDECYTAMQDIINELSQWSDKFGGKKIICPCDWDIVDNDENIYSLKIDFDENGIHGHTNTIKSLHLMEFEEVDKPKSVKIDKDKIDEFLGNHVKCNFIRTFVEHAEEWNIKSITASGYNPATGKGIKFQDINFKGYDICVTNPPFSMYGEFIGKLLTSDINFIILAPYLNRANPCVGLPLMLKKCYLGYGRCIHPNFYNPTAKNEYKTKIVCCDWITTFKDAQIKIDETRLLNGIKYKDYQDDYFEMENMIMKDGTHPIKVGKYTAIPDDYIGWIFCSIGVLDILSHDEFEWYMTNCKGYFNRTNPDANPFAHRASNEMVSNKDMKGFHGIILRRKK